MALVARDKAAESEIKSEMEIISKNSSEIPQEDIQNMLGNFRLNDMTKQKQTKKLKKKGGDKVKTSESKDLS